MIPVVYRGPPCRRSISFSGDMDENVIISRFFINYVYLEHLILVGSKDFRVFNFEISEYLIFNLPNLIIYSQSGTSNKIINKNFLSTNHKLKKIVFNNCKYEIIENQAFNSLDLEYFQIYRSELRTITTETFKDPMDT